MAESVPDRGTRRPLTQIGSVALAAHVFYELAAGVGMPLASILGPRRTAVCWAAGTALAVHLAAGAAPPDGLRRSARTEIYSEWAVGFVNGLGVAAALAHFTAWPRRSTAPPWLADCEGLGPELVPAYNTILYVTGGNQGRVAARRRYAVAASGEWVDEDGVRLPAGEVHAWEQGLNQTVCGLALSRSRLRRFPHVTWADTFVETGGAADEVDRQCPRCASVAGRRDADLRPRWRRVNPRP